MTWPLSGLRSLSHMCGALYTKKKVGGKDLVRCIVRLDGIDSIGIPKNYWGALLNDKQY